MPELSGATDCNASALMPTVRLPAAGGCVEGASGAGSVCSVGAWLVSNV